MKYYLDKMKLLLVAVLIIFVGLIFTWSKLFGNLQTNQNSSDNNPAGSITPSQKIKVNLTIDFGSGKITTYESMEISEGDTVYSILVKKLSEKGSSVTAKTDGYVVSINEISENSNYFWGYYVNGQMGSIAADKYILKDKDVIEWKYEKINQ